MSSGSGAKGEGAYGKVLIASAVLLPGETYTSEFLCAMSSALS